MLGDIEKLLGNKEKKYLVKNKFAGTFLQHKNTNQKYFQDIPKPIELS